MQVNILEPIPHDPRLREVAARLGWHHHRVLGALVEIMKTALLARSPVMQAKRIDGYAEQSGFAFALCEADLAEAMDSGLVRLSKDLIGAQLGWLAGVDAKRVAANAKRRELAEERKEGTGTGTGSETGTDAERGTETETGTKAGGPAGTPAGTPAGKVSLSAPAIRVLDFLSSVVSANQKGNRWKRNKAAEEAVTGLLADGFSDIQIIRRAQGYFWENCRPEWMLPPFTVPGFFKMFDHLYDAGELADEYEKQRKAAGK